jgi:hypothetical protein
MMAAGFGVGSDAHAPSISATPNGSRRRVVATTSSSLMTDPAHLLPRGRIKRRKPRCAKSKKHRNRCSWPRPGRVKQAKRSELAVESEIFALRGVKLLTDPNE